MYYLETDTSLLRFVIVRSFGAPTSEADLQAEISEKIEPIFEREQRFVFLNDVYHRAMPGAEVMRQSVAWLQFYGKFLAASLIAFAAIPRVPAVRPFYEEVLQALPKTVPYGIFATMADATDWACRNIAHEGLALSPEEQRQIEVRAAQADRGEWS